MSAAFDVAPEVYIPLQARPNAPIDYWPSDTDTAVEHAVDYWPVATPARALRAVSVAAVTRELPPLRLTRRGIVALAGLVIVAGVLLVSLAAAFGPSNASSGVSATSAVPAQVTVQPGETLWSISSRIAPNRDPRTEIADLQRINGLTNVDLSAGQVLRTR